MRSPTVLRERERYLNSIGKLSKRQLKQRGRWKEHLAEKRKRAIKKTRQRKVGV